MSGLADSSVLSSSDTMPDSISQIGSSLDEMPYAHGGAVGAGLIKQSCDDFIVDEDLGFAPDGDGDHWLIRVRKRNTNTLWLRGQLARIAVVKPMDVGYAGLKDRQAVTTQWFSVPATGADQVDWQELGLDDVELLEVSRHHKKLRVGSLRGNRFQITLRQVTASEPDMLHRLQALRQFGMPNYFGAQRFGHDRDNLVKANALFSGRIRRIERKQRGLLISAVRSQLFNEVLALRIAEGHWNQPLPGDAMLDEQGQVHQLGDDIDDILLAECASLRLHPSGPLWGRGRSTVTKQVAELENRALQPFEKWRDKLEHVGLKQERRALRIPLPDLNWQRDGDTWQLSFTLPAGCYATVLLRELVDEHEKYME